MKTSEIKNRIVDGLTTKFNSIGFSFQKKRFEFIGERNGQKFVFNLLITSWSGYWTVSVRLFISILAIERVYEAILGKSHSLTMGNTIERISKSQDGRRIVNGDMSIIIYHIEDVEAAIETLTRYYDTIAVEYFSKYNNLKAIDDIFNHAPFDHCPAHVGGSFDERCMKGLIVAKLVDNRDYEKLSTIYDDVIKGTLNENSITNYYKVKEYLMYNRIA
ncbi:MAG: hypothetical protein KGO82_15810 [Bacteroidota bacterium]|nr:hypothetical protein [Bacteroidota bacterium]